MSVESYHHSRTKHYEPVFVEGQEVAQTFLQATLGDANIALWAMALAVMRQLLSILSSAEVRFFQRRAKILRTSCFMAQQCLAWALMSMKSMMKHFKDWRTPRLPCMPWEFMHTVLRGNWSYQLSSSHRHHSTFIRCCCSFSMSLWGTAQKSQWFHNQK